jgi:uncharacterized membrane protein
MVLIDERARSMPTYVSADGLTIAGSNYGPETPEQLHGFRWTAATGVSDIGVLAGGGVYGVSGTGAIIVGGFREPAAPDWTPFRWTASTGVIRLSFNEGDYGIARAISSDGSTSVGYVYAAGVSNSAFRATNSGGLQLLSLGNLTYTEASAVSQDGSVIVGTSTQGVWIWDATNGARLLLAVLRGLGANVTSWDPYLVTGISGDGTVLVGDGTLAGVRHSWIARVGD